jgi:hypothetical protein
MKSYEEYYTELMNSIFHGKKKKSNSIWATVFIILFIVHVMLFTPVPTPGGIGAVIGLYLFGFPLIIIDFIAVIFYIKKQHPQGIGKVISYTVLTVICLILAFFVFGVILMKYPELVSK